MANTSIINILGVFLLVLSTSWSSFIQGQSYQGLDAVKFVNAIDNDTVTLDYRSSGPLMVIIFTSNFCPYSRKYDDRIKALHEEYGKREVDIVLVNPNTDSDDSLEEMKKKAQDEAYQYPYLKDTDQVLTGILGATRTPEVFLLKPVKNGFEQIYHGALDDNPQNENDVGNSYLKTAIEKALNGQPVINDYEKVTGCIIKK